MVLDLVDSWVKTLLGISPGDDHGLLMNAAGDTLRALRFMTIEPSALPAVPDDYDGPVSDYVGTGTEGRSAGALSPAAGSTAQPPLGPSALHRRPAVRARSGPRPGVGCGVMSTGAQNDALGAYGERVAARHLVEAGLVVLDRNWRCDAGEIDLVLRDGRRAGLLRGQDPHAARPAGTRWRRSTRPRPTGWSGWRRAGSSSTPGAHVDVRFDLVGVLRPDRRRRRGRARAGGWV